MKTLLRRAINQFPVVKRIVQSRHAIGSPMEYPPGHFYSPIPDIASIRENEGMMFGSIPREIPGINLRESEQLELLEKFLVYYEDLFFTKERSENNRFYYENNYYSYSDAIFLFCMIKHFKPKKIIEIGSGFSSALMLDTNDKFFNAEISCTFIEPNPDRLLSLVNQRGSKNIEILKTPLQNINTEIFSQLDKNDILFVDSTHVLKTFSDLNMILFDILPLLHKGVLIHFHDIFYPFEYPKKWIYNGRAWNELYALRAFLQFNDSFDIILFNTFLEHFHEQFFLENMPLCLENRGGSIWLSKARLKES